PNPAELLPGLFVPADDVGGDRSAVDEVVESEAEDRRLIADLEGTVRFAGDAQISTFDHLPIEMRVERLLVIDETLFLSAPEIGPEPERERTRLRIAVVVEQIVVHQRHRLEVCAVHDVVSNDGVPLLDISGAEMRIEDAAAPTDVAPIHPHFGKQHLADQPLEDRLEHTRCGRQSVTGGESKRISHVSQLELGTR